MVEGELERPVFDKQAGQRLREVRLRRKLSIDQVASQLRIPPKYLLALEEGELSAFSAEVYAKGAYLKYATFLQVDTRATWHAFLRTLAGRRENKPLRMLTPATWLQRVMTPTGIFVIVIALIVVLVAGYIGLQISAFVSVPDLEVAEPSRVIIEDDEVVVRGVTEGGAEVSVNGEKVLLDENNQFYSHLSLRPGINVLQVEAVGASGRTNLIERHILVPRFW